MQGAEPSLLGCSTLPSPNLPSACLSQGLMCAAPAKSPLPTPSQLARSLLVITVQHSWPLIQMSLEPEKDLSHSRASLWIFGEIFFTATN